MLQKLQMLIDIVLQVIFVVSRNVYYGSLDGKKESNRFFYYYLLILYFKYWLYSWNYLKYSKEMNWLWKLNHEL